MSAGPQIAPRELVIRDLDGNTATVLLDHDRITLGRSGANELSYPDDIGLSRQHLALVGREGHWTVEDLKSKNGTLLNGVRIESAVVTRTRLDALARAQRALGELEDAVQRPLDPGDKFPTNPESPVLNKAPKDSRP